MLISAVVLSVGAFNYRLSWLNVKEFRDKQVNHAIEFAEPIDPAHYESEADALVAALNRESGNWDPEYQRTLYHEIYDGLFKTIDIPIIGLEIYVEDLPLIGAFGVSVILLWFRFARRRERGIMLKLQRKAEYYSRSPKNFSLVEFIYVSAAFNQVFNTVSGIDVKMGKVGTFHRSSLARYYLNWLVALPLIMLSTVVSLDIYETYGWTGPLRIPDRSKLIALGQGHFSPEYLANEKNDEFIIGRLLDDSSSVYLRKMAEVMDRTTVEMGLLALKSQQDSIAIARDFEIKRLRNELLKSRDSYREYLHKAVALDAYIEYHKDLFDEMNHRTLRFGIDGEIWWIRTILPVVMIVVCLLLTISVLKGGTDRDGSFERIERIFEDMEIHASS